MVNAITKKSNLSLSENLEMSKSQKTFQLIRLPDI